VRAEYRPQLRAETPGAVAWRRGRLIMAQRPPLSVEAEHAPESLHAGGRLCAVAKARGTERAGPLKIVGGPRGRALQVAERFLKLRTQEARLAYMSSSKKPRRRSALKARERAWAPSAGLPVAPLNGGQTHPQRTTGGRLVSAIGVEPTGDTWRVRSAPLAETARRRSVFKKGPGMYARPGQAWASA